MKAEQTLSCPIASSRQTQQQHKVPSSSLSTNSDSYQRQHMESQKDGESLPPASVVLPPPPGAGVAAGGGEVEAGLGMRGILTRWRRENRLKKASIICRGLGFLFSLLAFITMASNSHGDWMSFDRYEEYRYLVGISVLSTLYAGAQLFRQVHELHTGKYTFPLQRRTSAIVDFCSDQVASYLLMSAASAAVPLTNKMREGADNIFTDTSAAAISMAFLAFIAFALSSVLSAHKLFTQSYI